jgi:UrcA family protein
MDSNVKTANRIPVAFWTAMLLACVWVTSRAVADDQVRTETVKFQDLNVDTPAGAQVLFSRIHAAANRVCSESRSDPLSWVAAAACAKRAEAQAIEKLGLPQLTAYYQMKTGKHTQSLSASR